MEILPIINNQLRKRNSYDEETEWSKRIRFAQKFYDSLDSLNISDKFDFEKKFSKINSVETNWKKGRIVKTKIIDLAASYKLNETKKLGVYCVKFNSDYMVVGLRNSDIKILNSKTYDRVKTLTGHKSGVHCIELNDKIIISGSSDSTIKIWDISTGNCLNTLYNHSQSVMSLKLNGNILVSCSMDKSIFVYDIQNLNSVKLIKNLINDPKLNELDLRCNTVDINDDFIIAGIYNKIKIWENKSDYQLVSSLNGHESIITCLYMLNNFVISGSQDKTVRVWDMKTKICIRVLEGHGDFINTIRCDDKRLLTSCYEMIKVWDLNMVLNADNDDEKFCIQTYLEPSKNKIFTIAFDNNKIVSAFNNNCLNIHSFLEQ